MRSVSLVAAVSIVLVANALALFHAARNRAGSPEAEVTLTNRELGYFNRSTTDDDSGVTLRLQWTDPSFSWTPGSSHPPYWLDRQKLQALGFDCSVNPASADAMRFYQRQRPRQVFIALEYDGPAWRARVDEFAKRQTKTDSVNSTVVGANLSRLVPVDADLDPVKLRARHSDRRAVLILPGVVGIALDRYLYPGFAEIVGRIQELPSSIHVARPFSDEFRRRDYLLYSVRLSYGSALEPWVTGVEFMDLR